MQHPTSFFRIPDAEIQICGIILGVRGNAIKKTRPRFGGFEKNALGARFTRWLGARFSSLRLRGALSDQMFFFFDIPKPACALHVELPTSAAVAIGRVDSSMAAEIRSRPYVGS